jgi:hypothetical protein
MSLALSIYAWRRQLSMRRLCPCPLLAWPTIICVPVSPGAKERSAGRGWRGFAREMQGFEFGRAKSVLEELTLIKAALGRNTQAWKARTCFPSRWRAHFSRCAEVFDESVSQASFRHDFIFDTLRLKRRGRAKQRLQSWCGFTLDLIRT